MDDLVRLKELSDYLVSPESVDGRGWGSRDPGRPNSHTCVINIKGDSPGDEPEPVIGHCLNQILVGQVVRKLIDLGVVVQMIEE